MPVVSTCIYLIVFKMLHIALCGVFPNHVQTLVILEVKVKRF